MEDEKVLIQRTNVILRVSKQQVDYYLNQGYNVIDEQGNVVKASIPRDLGTLQKAYVEHLKEIEDLKMQLKELSSQKPDNSPVAKRTSRKKQQ